MISKQQSCRALVPMKTNLSMMGFMMKSLYWIWGLRVRQKMHGGHVAVILQSASILQRDSVGESPRFCKCTCQQFLRMQKSIMEMKDDAIWIQARLLHSKAKSTKILQFSVFFFRYSLRIRKLFIRDLLRVRNGSFVVPATPKRKPSILYFGCLWDARP